MSMQICSERLLLLEYLAKGKWLCFPKKREAVEFSKSGQTKPFSRKEVTGKISSRFYILPRGEQEQRDLTENTRAQIQSSQIQRTEDL